MTVQRNLVSRKKGYWLTLAAVAFQVSAYAIDKLLTASTSPDTIETSSFLFPGIAALLPCCGRAKSTKWGFRSSEALTLLLPVALACAYLAVVHAFRVADSVAVLAIAETAPIFTGLLAYFVLGGRENTFRKVILAFSALCAWYLFAVSDREHLRKHTMKCSSRAYSSSLLHFSSD